VCMDTRSRRVYGPARFRGGSSNFLAHSRSLSQDQNETVKYRVPVQISRSDQKTQLHTHTSQGRSACNDVCRTKKGLKICSGGE